MMHRITEYGGLTRPFWRLSCVHCWCGAEGAAHTDSFPGVSRTVQHGCRQLSMKIHGVSCRRRSINFGHTSNSICKGYCVLSMQGEYLLVVILCCARDVIRWHRSASLALCAHMICF